MKKKILVADDDPGIIDSLTLLLEEFGYEVSTEVDGENLYKLKKDLPDLLLLDIWMSGANGGDICTFLKKQPATKNLPIILISANKDTAQIAAQSGADDYITKPFELTDFLEKVEKFVK